MERAPPWICVRSRWGSGRWSSGSFEGSNPSEKAEGVDAPAGLDDLAVLEAVDRDARDRDPAAGCGHAAQIAGVGHLPAPARDDRVGLRDLVLDREPHVGERAAVQLDRPFHPCETVGAVRVLGSWWTTSAATSS